VSGGLVEIAAKNEEALSLFTNGYVNVHEWQTNYDLPIK